MNARYQTSYVVMIHVRIQMVVLYVNVLTDTYCYYLHFTVLTTMSVQTRRRVTTQRYVLILMAHTAVHVLRASRCILMIHVEVPQSCVVLYCIVLYWLHCALCLPSYYSYLDNQLKGEMAQKYKMTLSQRIMVGYLWGLGKEPKLGQWLSQCKMAQTGFRMYFASIRHYD